MTPSILSLASCPSPVFRGTLAWVPGPGELILILLVVFFLFGAKKLPELARSMGSSVTQFKKGLKDPEALASESESTRAAEGGGNGANGGEEPRREGP